MADVAAADVTYTVNNKNWIGRRGYLINLTVTFGNGTLTYPTGGVAATKGKMGAPNFVESVTFQNPNSTGYSLYWDPTNVKFLMFYNDNNNTADGPAIEHPNATFAAQTWRAELIGY